MNVTEGWRLPEAFEERARRYLAGEGPPPVVPRVAATVVLLRPADAGFEVYVLRRAASMAFASGVYAFPGGGVDAADAGTDLDWAGPPPEEWARRLGRPAGEAQAVICAAVREVFEEAGVLLAEGAPDRGIDGAEGAPARGGDGARGAPGHGAGGASGGGFDGVEGAPGGGIDGAGGAEGGDGGAESGLEADRQRLVRREVHLAEVLARRGLVLRSDLLGAWARWITPEFEARRFDTYFFVAALPERQLPRDVSGEADHTMWVRPADAVAGFEAGRIAMLPPTVMILRELSAYPDIAGVLAAVGDRDAATAVTPRPEIAPDGTIRLRAR
ncbi:NUDIX hydrolase [Phytohabitans sp. ZYX-F-186]|uniref:NUDIX hydrolase n=1 Tax=Phytohabitans maris TaxID=3071409 RepID=A0ABU0ZJJ2_9ACTN|nr:NUDIX hydrolase [Phytohabitans sp. ZYX-F-186]MDQ7906666.1 NUDIX hydrolase [Phytohabitans sp. ZYX-F-186]